MNNHYVCQCKNCGRHSVHQISLKSIIKCPYCRKSTKLKKSKEFGLSLKISGPYSGSEAAKNCAEMNAYGKR